jgi:hypothetical protein
MIGEYGILTHEYDRGSWQTSHPSVSVMMMLLMSVMMTIRTGRCAAHSATRLARVAATGLAQRHAPPEVAREFAHFLWQWHRLIEIGQELSEHSSSCHLFCSPHHVCSIVSRSPVQPIAQATSLTMEPSPSHLRELDILTTSHDHCLWLRS